MIVEIDFSTDTITRSSVLEEPDYITRFPAPNDYHPLVYDYIPQTAGVYDPNGFFLKPQPQVEEP